MVGDAPKDWVELYQSALVELDASLLSQKIEAAHHAIQQRIGELHRQKDGAQEHQALEDALRTLRTLKRQIE